MAVENALPLVGTRLVSEQRAEGRDYRDEPGLHDIFDHSFNVFVGPGTAFAITQRLYQVLCF
jgi:hypothetical protein